MNNDMQKLARKLVFNGLFTFEKDGHVMVAEFITKEDRETLLIVNPRKVTVEFLRWAGYSQRLTLIDFDKLVTDIPESKAVVNDILDLMPSIIKKNNDEYLFGFADGLSHTIK